MKKESVDQANKTSDGEQLPGYPLYSGEEDIYIQEKKELYSESEESHLDEGLDVPGAELDDANELIGEEDEENNYYSLGGDDHNDLEENNGE